MSGNNVVLQDRDRRLLSEIGIMRITDCDLAKTVAAFGCARRTNMRLLKLTRAGLLNRFFVGTVASGRKAIYTLSRKGAALVGSPQHLVSRRFGQTVVGDLFVDHQMRINQVYATVKFAALPQGVSFISWRNFSKALSPSVLLSPDGYFELQTPDGIRAHFLEVDMGTETRSVWKKKIQSYVHLALAGEFKRIFGHSQFRVLILATSERRVTNIRSVIARHTDKIFYLASFQSINWGDFCSSRWLRPTGELWQSLL